MQGPPIGDGLAAENAALKARVAELERAQTSLGPTLIVERVRAGAPEAAAHMATMFTHARTSAMFSVPVFTDTVGEGGVGPAEAVLIDSCRRVSVAVSPQLLRYADSYHRYSSPGTCVLYVPVAAGSARGRILLQSVAVCCRSRAGNRP